MMLKLFSGLCLSGLLVLLRGQVAAATTVAQVPTNQAASQSLTVTISADQVRTYGRLMEQVVGTANDTVSDAFATNPDADPIKLTVLVHRNGQVLPVLVADISRDQWQQQPDIQNWAHYSPSVRMLLGYTQPNSTPPRSQVARRRPIIENAAFIDELD
ncbi:hypothetical protein Lepto7375DRAFT_8314 [Leptolyngbya sp. PCC 7375]|nr:hypothetical protein Lepto7375DRAFT_8314 [Leptolyngbya sp. PCC 7375]